MEVSAYERAGMSNRTCMPCVDAHLVVQTEKIRTAAGYCFGFFLFAAQIDSEFIDNKAQS